MSVSNLLLIFLSTFILVGCQSGEGGGEGQADSANVSTALGAPAEKSNQNRPTPTLNTAKKDSSSSSGGNSNPPPVKHEDGAKELVDNITESEDVAEAQDIDKTVENDEESSEIEIDYGEDDQDLVDALTAKDTVETTDQQEVKEITAEKVLEVENKFNQQLPAQELANEQSEKGEVPAVGSIDTQSSMEEKVEPPKKQEKEKKIVFVPLLGKCVNKTNDEHELIEGLYGPCGNLENEGLDEYNFKKKKFHGANLIGADLSDTKNLTIGMLVNQEVTFNMTTVFPANIKAPKKTAIKANKSAIKSNKKKKKKATKKIADYKKDIKKLKKEYKKTKRNGASKKELKVVLKKIKKLQKKSNKKKKTIKVYNAKTKRHKKNIISLKDM